MFPSRKRKDFIGSELMFSESFERVILYISAGAEVVRRSLVDDIWLKKDPFAAVEAGKICCSGKNYF